MRRVKAKEETIVPPREFKTQREGEEKFPIAMTQTLISSAASCLAISARITGSKKSISICRFHTEAGGLWNVAV